MVLILPRYFHHRQRCDILEGLSAGRSGSCVDFCRAPIPVHSVLSVLQLPRKQPNPTGSHQTRHGLCARRLSAGLHVGLLQFAGPHVCTSIGQQGGIRRDGRQDGRLRSDLRHRARYIERIRFAVHCLALFRFSSYRPLYSSLHS